VPLVNPIERLNKPMTANKSTRASKDVRSGDDPLSRELFDLVANNQSTELVTRLENGADPTTETLYTGETLLHAAVAYGASECVHALLEAKANVNATTALFQESPIHLAIQEGFFDIFHDLIRHGADIESQTCEGEGPIFTAVKYNRIEMFRVLVRKGADVNKLNFGGLAPIHFAVMDGSLFFTDSLLWHGANPTKGELNPYLFAFRAGDSQIAHSIQIAAPSLAVPTQLHSGVFSVIKANDVPGLQRLIFKGFDLNLIDVLEGAPLHCAVEHDAFDCMKILIDNGANVNARTIQKLETPIQIAIRTKNDRIYHYLMQHKVDLSLRNKEGESALFYGIRSGNERAIADSIRQGADVNERNDVGVTPLYVAVSLKETPIVSKLLHIHNADPLSEILPSLRLAKDMEDAELISLLAKRGADKANLRTARADARKTRLARGTTAPGRRRAPAQPEKPAPAPKHVEGMCFVCERNKITQKLIPCGDVVACRGCIKNFIEQHLPCPVCRLSFYATATIPEA
jgi:ankyrin repeat protein